jgi:hypothetical protein
LFTDDDEDKHSTEDLARLCTVHNVTKEMLTRTEEMLTGNDELPDPDI